jgi:hypothetical protein
MGGACSKLGRRREILTQFWYESENERDQSEDLGTDGDIIKTDYKETG